MKGRESQLLKDHKKDGMPTLSKCRSSLKFLVPRCFLNGMNRAFFQRSAARLTTLEITLVKFVSCGLLTLFKVE